ncbi:MAG TPA: methyltransferase domain-containing protein [Dermatophilaceae bacterium]
MKPSDMQRAYDRSADAWASGPEQVYTRLAQTLVDAAPVPLQGARVLDLGAGTGVAGRAALAAGAVLVVAVDNAAGMLRRGGSMRPVLADACALPFTTDSFDLVVAAISLGHVSDPVRALRETRRVGGALLVSAFEAEWTHPAKAAVDQALVPFGFRPPPWYVVLKRNIEPQVDEPDHLGALATAAGYRDVSVHTVQVAVGLNTPAQLTRWRLGMAHVAPFVQSLPPSERAAVQRAAESALVGAPPLVIPLVVLAAT